MGQGQSSSGQPAADEAAPLKTDYYELLGVERTATEEELKKAYRRKALELHPDRNYGNVEETTRLFAEVQTAYEVLSDPQERAWYDSHKDILLRGEQPGQDGEEFSYNIRMTTAVEVQQLMLKFNGRMEFSDAPSGFYGGLHDFFEKLAKEEDIACQWEDLDPLDWPEFGLKDDHYEDVVRPFYSAWTSFATKKSFSWKDAYRLADAPDRRIRRLMEKENKKLRDEAIQEYNDAVRSLIAFVRKRDPRVQDNQKSEAERQKILRDAAAAQAARSRAQRDAQLRNALSDMDAVPDWAQSREKDEHEGGFTSESEIEEHEYDCVVCDKTFKSEAQFQAHERSKKHVKLLKQLKREMKDEDADLQERDQTSRIQSDVDEDNDLEDDVVKVSQHRSNGEPESEDDSTHDAKIPMSKSPTNVPRARQDSESSHSDDDYASREDIEARLTGSTTYGISSTLTDLSLEATPVTSDTDGAAGAKSKVGKAKQKRAKKAAQAAAGETKVAFSEHSCARCGNEFDSKTQLFKHLKDNPSHAALKASAPGKKAGGAKGKKR
jgi:DnaJ homolog subfamily A member 5